MQKKARLTMSPGQRCTRLNICPFDGGLGDKPLSLCLLFPENQLRFVPLGCKPLGCCLGKLMGKRMCSAKGEQKLRCEA